MEHIEQNNSGMVLKPKAPWWYTVIFVLWGPISLVAGFFAAAGMIDPSRTLPIAIIVDVLQTILLGLSVQKGRQYFSTKQLFVRFLLVFLFLAVVPIVLIMIDTPGEITLGALMLVVFLAFTVAQVSFLLLYALARRLVRFSPYKVLAGCVVLHAIIMIFLLDYLLAL